MASTVSRTVAARPAPLAVVMSHDVHNAARSGVSVLTVQKRKPRPQRAVKCHTTGWARLHQDTHPGPFPKHQVPHHSGLLTQKCTPEQGPCFPPGGGQLTAHTGEGSEPPPSSTPAPAIKPSVPVLVSTVGREEGRGPNPWVLRTNRVPNHSPVTGTKKHHRTGRGRG